MNITQQTRQLALIIISFTVILLLTALFNLHLIGEENKYASAAWQMYTQHNYFVPMIGDAVYPDKPPLFFWLLQIGWAIIGTHSGWVRILPTLFALGNTYLTWHIANSLWPEQKSIGLSATLILCGSFFWIIAIPIVRFDMLLTFFSLLALYGILLTEKSCWKGMVLIGFANALGILSKGPVIFVYTLPLMILAGNYLTPNTQSRSRFYAGLFLSLLITLGLICFWLIPAMMQGGTEYSHAILIGQSVGRVTGEVGSDKAWWSYLISTPYLFYPWALFLPFYVAIRQTENYYSDKLFRWLLFSFVISFCVLSLISAKELRYILPLLPIYALLLGRIVHPHLQNKYPYIFALLLSLVMIILGIVILALPLMLSKEHYLQNLPAFTGIGFILLGIIYAIYNRSTTVWQQMHMLFMITFASGLLYFVSYMRVIDQVKDVSSMATRVENLLMQRQTVVSLDPFSNWMQYEGRWPHPLPVVKKNRLPEYVNQTNPTWAISLAMQQAPYVDPASCFQTSYDRKRLPLLLCKLK